MTAMTAMTAMSAMTALPSRGTTQLAALTAASGDPLVTEALVSSRARNTPEAGALANAGRHGGHAPGQLPAAEDPAHLGWWQPEVRGHLCAFELASQFRFEWDAGQQAARLFHEPPPGAGSAARARRMSVVSIVRPDRGVFDSQLQMVLAHADSELRRSRMHEVQAQVLPQVPFWASVVPLSPWRTPRTYELIGVALGFGNQVCHRFKHAMAVPRPSELSPLVQPILQTPGWAAYPSGHATEAFMFARLILGLLGQDMTAETELSATLALQAASIANNRVYAGLHFPVDSVAGRVLGCSLADAVMALCGHDVFGDGRFRSRHLDARQRHRLDLDIGSPIDRTPPRQAASGLTVTPGKSGIDPNPLLAQMWKSARSELQGLGF